MSVFLTILKILLIVLLCVIGIVLLIVFLILFAPVIYGRSLEKSEGFTYDVQLSWLFRFLYIKAKDDGEKQEDAFKLFWFYDVPKGEGLWALLKKAFDWVYPRAVYILTSVYEDEEIASDPSLMKSAKLFSECVKGIILSVLPKKLSGDLIYGFSSPDYTGYLTAFLSALIPAHDEFLLQPDFTQQIFNADLDFKGRIFIYKPLYHILRILLSSDVRRFLGLINEKYQREVEHGKQSD